MSHTRSPRSCARLRVGLTLLLAGLISAATLVPGPARRAYAQGVAPSWKYTGNLNTGRHVHTATLLQNGKVLVAGGDSVGAGNSAELYNPATGTWSSTGNLNTQTSFVAHTATLLPNGKVLVVGDINISSNSQLYDPATGMWSYSGNLNQSRFTHTATLLPNGKVLVAGGYDGFSVLKSAELYDPTTGTWSNTGNLDTARANHTATLLQNGKVMVAGGCVDSSCRPTNSAGSYDPATGTWSRTGNLNTARLAHTTTLLPNGKVLVAGGYGGLGFGDPSTNSSELYDTATATWSITGNLSIARAAHTATLLSNGKVLVGAGFDGCDDCLGVTSAELYDAATGTWSLTAELNIGRDYHTATLLLNGNVLVAGGLGSGNSAELYDPGAISNQIDDAQFFVRQHYRDFLNRDADANGLAFWTNEIISCGTDVGCIEAKRINVSAAFFISIEFQETGYLVYRITRSSYGDISGTPVPVRLNEFLPDTQTIGDGVIVNQAGWEQLLENNKQAFTAEFVQRSRFTSAYPTSMTPDQFVDQLFINADVTPLAADRAAAINEFGSATSTADTAARARALRRVAENATLAQQEFNKAFVLMQYFGYLRRNPNDPPELTLDFQGYNFWLNKLNQFNGSFINAEMVKSFLVSTEYRQRFGSHDHD